MPPPPTPPSTIATSRVIVILYAFAATAHVMATASGPKSLVWATAPLLMPLLAGVATFAAGELGQRPAPWALAGLGLAAGGDLVSLAGLSPVRAALLAGCLMCYAVAFASARRWPGPIGGAGLALVVTAATLCAVRVSAAGAVTAIAPTLAYVVGQALVVTAWIRPPASAVPVPLPRAEAEVLTRR